ncbi:MAG: exopolyphosphatase [Lachnospiraceae bacterium]|nr:exopolyphosphatase [Lachnospiraceae bacterium]
MKKVIFAAIYIRSYETGMKIFELSARNGMKELNHVINHLELGKDAFTKEKIGQEMVDNLCKTLNDFKGFMKEYGVDEYRVCATSALREVKNTRILLDHIRVRTGFQVEILSNSEHRFIGYKSVASKWENFGEVIKKGTAIVDVGGGSIQVSLFDKDSLITTQNIKLGSLRIRETLAALENRSNHYGQYIEELINTELYHFKKFYLKDRNVKNVIVSGEFITNLLAETGSSTINSSVSAEEYKKIYDKISNLTPEAAADKLGVSQENARLILPFAIIYKRFMEIMEAETIWAPNRDLADGIAFDYAQQKQIIKSEHNFEDDIIASAKNMARRYMAGKNHINNMEGLAVQLFDATKKLHGLGKREQLLLRIAVILCDCGKYISIAKSAECAYHIIMATEIIGLSHKEREKVAYIVKFKNGEFEYYEELVSHSNIGVDDYLVIAKLTGMLRLIEALDYSNKQKCKSTRFVMKDKTLYIMIESNDDIALEKEKIAERADFVQEILGIIPVVKQKKSI